MGKPSRLQAKKKARVPAATILEFPDDLLELVLLRVRTPVCLLRAAATCKPWRRVVAGSGFLRRFRAIHGPHLLLGHYCVNTVEAEDDIIDLRAEFFPSPRRSAPCLRRRLSLNFFLRRPAASPWLRHEHELTDSHGGILAFVRDNWYAVVFDPWNRKYLKLDFPWLHPESDDEESPYRYLMEHDDEQCHSLGAFLLDAGGALPPAVDPPLSGFRLLCAWLVRSYMDDTVTAHACVYSARDRRWLRPTGGRKVSCAHWTGCTTNKNRFLGRAGGSILWSGHHGRVLVLDETTGKFSTFRLPGAPRVADVYRMSMAPLEERPDRRVIGGGAAGGVRIVGVVDGDQLEVLTWARGARACTVVRRVGLCQLANIEASRGLQWLLLDNATASADVVLGAFISASRTMKVFSLDVETMKVRRMEKSMALSAERVFPYELPWTQSTISVCV